MAATKARNKAKDYQVMPPLSEVQYRLLKADIKRHGIRVPVEYDTDGNVLDGHHRLRAAEELGIAEADIPKRVRDDLKTEDEKRAHIIALNLARRHLSREERATLVARLKDEHRWSLRKLAQQIGVSHQTIANDLAGVKESGNGKLGSNGSPEPITCVCCDWAFSPDDVKQVGGKRYRPDTGVTILYFPEVESDGQPQLHVAGIDVTAICVPA